MATMPSRAPVWSACATCCPVAPARSWVSELGGAAHYGDLDAMIAEKGPEIMVIATSTASSALEG